ncbi:hypothetical protein L1987_37737 [Smallanthus sonchifolius]|uniref:Uncharacterized protein n=1 Tax=Smallanthus sonchifolius TaxID=185202 RepID=A0ACB9HIE8_9ASTR|nr:hypothetical protein L1987_37737 [Smallanthus sonchifolius]
MNFASHLADLLELDISLAVMCSGGLMKLILYTIVHIQFYAGGWGTGRKIATVGGRRLVMEKQETVTGGDGKARNGNERQFFTGSWGTVGDGKIKSGNGRWLTEKRTD